jgi:hypothetical protein
MNKLIINALIASAITGNLLGMDVNSAKKPNTIWEAIASMDSSHITAFSPDAMNFSNPRPLSSGNNTGMSPLSYAIGLRKWREEKQEQVRLDAWVVDLVKHGADLNNFGAQQSVWLHSGSCLSLAETAGQVDSPECFQQLAEVVSEPKYIHHLLLGMHAQLRDPVHAQLRDQMKDDPLTRIARQLRYLFFGESKSPQYIAMKSAIANVTRISKQRFGKSAF